MVFDRTLTGDPMFHGIRPPLRLDNMDHRRRLSSPRPRSRRGFPGLGASTVEGKDRQGGYGGGSDGREGDDRPVRSQTRESEHAGNVGDTSNGRTISSTGTDRAGQVGDAPDGRDDGVGRGEGPGDSHGEDWFLRCAVYVERGCRASTTLCIRGRGMMSDHDEIPRNTWTIHFMRYDR